MWPLLQMWARVGNSLLIGFFDFDLTDFSRPTFSFGILISLAVCASLKVRKLFFVYVTLHFAISLVAEPDEPITHPELLWNCTERTSGHWNIPYSVVSYSGGDFEPFRSVFGALFIPQLLDNCSRAASRKRRQFRTAFLGALRSLLVWCLYQRYLRGFFTTFSILSRIYRRYSAFIIV